MRGFLRLLLLVLGVGCLLALAYFVYARALSKPASDPAAQSAPALQPGFAAGSGAIGTGVVSDGPRTAPAGESEYRSAQNHISLFYPSDLLVKTYAEGGGASTVTFQNVSSAMGFQIFIVPYSGTQISTARFKQDEPSGVMNGPLNVTVGGVPATSFYSTNTLLGDTAEVWFLRGGYLYEVTAPKSEAEWLSQILLTLQFTN